MAYPRMFLDWRIYSMGWIDGNYVEVGTHVQFSKNSNAQRYWKRQSNKKIRRYKENIPHGCHYKKLFPYLWKIYF